MTDERISLHSLSCPFCASDGAKLWYPEENVQNRKNSWNVWFSEENGLKINWTFEWSINITELIESNIPHITDFEWAVLSKFKVIYGYLNTAAIPGILCVILVMLLGIHHLAKKRRRSNGDFIASEDYDVFVSSSDVDCDFVQEILSSEKGYRLCVFSRDFVYGEKVADNILKSIQNSRKCIVFYLETFYIQSGVSRNSVMHIKLMQT